MLWIEESVAGIGFLVYVLKLGFAGGGVGWGRWVEGGR